MSFSAWRLPAFANGTVIGTKTAKWFGKQPPAMAFDRYPHAVRVRSGWGIEHPSRFVNWAGIPTAHVNVRRESAPRLWGVWHQTIEELPDRVHFDGWDEEDVLDDPAERVRLLEAINRSEWGPFVPTDKLAFYASGGGSTRRILWLGVLGDLSILAAFAAIIFSLVKLRGEIKWRKPGCCTECDYDLAGLTTSKCPECGAAVISSDSPRAT